MNMRATLALVALLAGCATTPESRTTTASSGATTVVPGSQEDLVANVGDRIFFDFDRSEIAGHGALALHNTLTLDRQAAWLAKYAQNNVQIAGNCDERGTEEYNLALGNRRADTTRRVGDGHRISAGIGRLQAR